MCFSQVHSSFSYHVLKKFQSRTTCRRRLVDEIAEPANPPAIVLQHLDDFLYNTSATKALSATEV
ncbi:hypothetical protein BDV33DRAFT_185459 [Aspergillus novoparasiticus]|uniref:Uncharacterized protein n=1 Tax=Aspergillus novoparasiticus TaxID=986946 RepID=A0A5N6E6A5_9EURO|nr:hypothetical protein BDV33DRAFT_185459 [Aspergillus novoparasiticus]